MFKSHWLGITVLLICIGGFFGCPTTPVNTEQVTETATNDASPTEQPPKETLVETPTEKTALPELPPPQNPLDNMGTPEEVKGGFFFTEGPLWDTANQRVLFSDLIGNTIYKMALDEPPVIEALRKPSELSNGLALDAKGRLVACERITRRLSVMEPDGTVNTLVGEYEGKKLNGPNDITVHANGAIYFTDPPYALEPVNKELDFNGVFRLSPDGKTLTALWKGADGTLPNGIILSPYDRKLYFADAANDVIWVGIVKADGSIETPTEFTKTGDGPDGLAMDATGNLYVATKAGIEVYSREGKKWGVITVPKHPANMTFIGEKRDILLIAARTTLYQIKNMPIAGVH
jgi:gluconolactonase